MQRGAAQVAGQQGIDQGPARRGAGPNSAAGPGEARLAAIFWYSAVCLSRGLIHGAFTSQSMGPDVTGCICFALRTACRP